MSGKAKKRLGALLAAGALAATCAACDKSGQVCTHPTNKDGTHRTPQCHWGPDEHTPKKRMIE